jgi:hypothetical protein
MLESELFENYSSVLSLVSYALALSVICSNLRKIKFFKFLTAGLIMALVSVDSFLAGLHGIRFSSTGIPLWFIIGLFFLAWAVWPEFIAKEFEDKSKDE